MFLSSINTVKYEMFFSSRTRIYLFLVFSTLFACNSTVELYKEDRNIALEPNHGLLLLSVDLNQLVQSIEIKGPTNFVLTRDDLRSKTNYFLIPLPQGKYTIDKIRLNDQWRFELSNGLWDFDVNPGVISYVGQLNIRSKGFYPKPKINIDLVNNSAQALVFLEDKFPTILNDRTVSYSGPGNDLFFEYVERQNKEGKW